MSVRNCCKPKTLTLQSLTSNANKSHEGKWKILLKPDRVPLQSASRFQTLASASANEQLFLIQFDVRRHPVSVSDNGREARAQLMLPGDRWRPSNSKCQSVFRASTNQRKNTKSIEKYFTTKMVCIRLIDSRQRCMPPLSMTYLLYIYCMMVCQEYAVPLLRFKQIHHLERQLKTSNIKACETHCASRALIASNKAVHNEAQRPQQSCRKASCKYNQTTSQFMSV